MPSNTLKNNGKIMSSYKDIDENPMSRLLRLLHHLHVKNVVKPSDLARNLKSIHT